MKKILISFLSILSIFLLVLGGSPTVAYSALCNVDMLEADGTGQQFINPDYALCSVHAYNIGLGQNPTDAANQELMREVIRLKATIIAQQMKKQYDFLDVTIKRFETQLQKAVLVSRLEAAGGASSDRTGGGGGQSGSSLQGVNQNCGGSGLAALDCLLSNNREMLNILSRGSVNTQMRDQMMRDYRVYSGINNGLGGYRIQDLQFTKERPSGASTGCEAILNTRTNNLSTSQARECLQFMQTDINNVIRAETRVDNQARAGGMSFQPVYNQRNQQQNQPESDD
ncbi:MAG: hypothetical protein FWG80_00135 [Alphaproteobacteria bacterium]|nr:hypothetical protein [Alphaproteobacteria bacterium]